MIASEPVPFDRAAMLAKHGILVDGTPESIAALDTLVAHMTIGHAMVHIATHGRKHGVHLLRSPRFDMYTFYEDMREYGMTSGQVEDVIRNMSPTLRKSEPEITCAPDTWHDGDVYGVLMGGLRVCIQLERDVHDSSSSLTGRLHVSVDARVWDDRPDMGSCTHECPGSYAPSEIRVTDDGLLTALRRLSTCSDVDFRSGFTLKMPIAFVAPIRAALDSATQAIKGC